MRQSLRTRLLLSHLLLVGLLGGVCLIAVAGFFRLGQSVNRILEDNYKSVVAAQNMKEALERLDSAAAFAAAGQSAAAGREYAGNVDRFETGYRTEAANITEPGEKVLVATLGVQFAAYKTDLLRLVDTRAPLSRARANALYFDTLQPGFGRVKGTVQAVLNINQTAILRADERAKAEAQAASGWSIAITAVAVVGGMALARTTITALMTPIVSLTRQAAEIGTGHLHQRIETRREDEIGTLARTFNDMAERLETARKREAERLERAERISDAALADLYDPVIVSDADGKVMYLNRAAEGLFGDDKAAHGRPVGDVVRNRALYVAVLSALGKRTENPDAETAHMTWSGRTYRVRVNPMGGTDEKLLGAVAVLEDVTSEQEVDRLKTEFIGVASHELRTPVTSLLLGVQLLGEEAVGTLNTDQMEITAALRDDLLRLERMMRDLLDITRLEAGATPPRFALVKSAELADGARQTVQAQATAQNIRLEAQIADGLPVVRADRGQIGRVLLNLLANALRHTPGGGTVIVGAEAATGGVRFFVRDTGEGIPDEHQPRIFERFVQVPGATRGGAGLGLSLAQTMVRAHGGEITVKSKVGTGSEFAFVLPVGGKEIP